MSPEQIEHVREQIESGNVHRTLRIVSPGAANTPMNG
jgi:hypothetical protein